jgi:hypothetical protein
VTQVTDIALDAAKTWTFLYDKQTRVNQPVRVAQQRQIREGGSTHQIAGHMLPKNLVDQYLPGDCASVLSYEATYRSAAVHASCTYTE